MQGFPWFWTERLVRRAELVSKGARKPLAPSSGYLSQVPKDKSFPYRNAGSSWRGLPLCRSLPLMQYLFWDNRLSLLCPRHECFCYVQKENQGQQLDLNIFCLMSLPASSHINQTSSKKRYFRHCKGAEFKTSYYIIVFLVLFVTLVII